MFWTTPIGASSEPSPTRPPSSRQDFRPQQSTNNTKGTAERRGEKWSIWTLTQPRSHRVRLQILLNCQGWKPDSVKQGLSLRGSCSCMHWLLRPSSSQADWIRLHASNRIASALAASHPTSENSLQRARTLKTHAPSPPGLQGELSVDQLFTSGANICPE